MSTALGPATRVNTYATLSVIGALVLAPVGIVLGAIALRQIARTGERGRSLALVGLWFGVGVTALYLVAIVVVVVVTVSALWFLTEIPPEVLR